MDSPYNKLISLGALVALTGYVTSGPLGFLLVHPQPPWLSASEFVRHYDPIQNVPYYFGFVLMGGMLMIAAGHYLNESEQNSRQKFLLLIALAVTIVFSTLISFNYICQTTFVHNLARHYKPEYDSAIAAFSMSNPLSFCWANEMWGYGFLGISTWLMAGYYRDRHALIRGMLITNGLVSLLSVVFTMMDAAWVETFAGLIAYFLWNVLMIALMVILYRYTSRAPRLTNPVHT